MKTKEPLSAPKSVPAYRGLLDVVILPKWKVERRRDIDHERLRIWVTWLATNPAARQNKRSANPDAGLSPARVIQAHQFVHQVLAYAVRSKYRATNPADDIELPRKTAAEQMALSHDLFVPNDTTTGFGDEDDPHPLMPQLDPSWMTDGAHSVFTGGSISLRTDVCTA